MLSFHKVACLLFFLYQSQNNEEKIIKGLQASKKFHY